MCSSSHSAISDAIERPGTVTVRAWRCGSAALSVPWLGSSATCIVNGPSVWVMAMACHDHPARPAAWRRALSSKLEFGLKGPHPARPAVQQSHVEGDVTAGTDASTAPTRDVAASRQRIAAVLGPDELQGLGPLREGAHARLGPPPTLRVVDLLRPRRAPKLPEARHHVLPV